MPLLIALLLLAVAATPAQAWPGGLACRTEAAAGTALRAGVNCREIASGGDTRRYVVYVSPRARATIGGGGSVPLVTMLHGSGGSGEQFLQTSGWREKADAEGLVAMFPSGLRYRVDIEQPPRLGTKWGAYDLGDEVDETFREPADDVAFLRSAIRDVKASTSIDSDAVYLSGFSNGGSMCMRAALELTRLVHAFGCNAGTVGDAQRTVTAGAPFRPVMYTWGNRDPYLIERIRESDPAIREIPMSPADAFAIPVVSNLTATQLTPLRLGDAYDVRVQRPALFQLRFDEPVSQQFSAELQWVLLDDVGHRYADVMPSLLWRFFSR